MRYGVGEEGDRQGRGYILWASGPPSDSKYQPEILPFQMALFKWLF